MRPGCGNSGGSADSGLCTSRRQRKGKLFSDKARATGSCVCAFGDRQCSRGFRLHSVSSELCPLQGLLCRETLSESKGIPTVSASCVPRGTLRFRVSLLDAPVDRVAIHASRPSKAPEHLASNSVQKSQSRGAAVVKTKVNQRDSLATQRTAAVSSFASMPYDVDSGRLQWSNVCIVAAEMMQYEIVRLCQCVDNVNSGKVGLLLCYNVTKI